MNTTKRLVAMGLAVTMLGTTLPALAATDSGEAPAAVETTAETTAETAVETTAEAEQAQEVAIVLSDDGITVDGQPVSTDTGDAVYVGAEIIYYHDLDTYESGNPYGEGTASDKHTDAEAAAHTCLTITKEGTYRISGTLSQGQIAIDLGKDRRTDPTAVVTLILDNANITCTVAPAVIFYNVYECDTAWIAYDNGEAEEYTASATQDTAAAGANVILADGSVNTVTGSHVARIYKDNGDKKKKYKYDGAFYSVQSLNINGETVGDGVLNIIADNEGLDSELHLTVNGGKINIQSQDDGINTNEDNVSVTTINGGSLHIVAGLGAEGDGVDSNGYLVINGGVVISLAKPTSDSGLDSDCGSYINGGYVVATGSTMDWAESDSEQVTLNLQFASSQAADEAIIVTDLDGKVVFAYDPEQDETTGEHYRGYQGAVVSCPQFQVGATYNVYVGGNVEGTDVDGLYDAATVTGFTGATLQQYTGTDVGFGGPGGGMGGPGGFPGGEDNGEFQPPEGFDPGQMGQPPEMNGDFQPPEGFQMPEMPEGFDPANMQRPDDGQRPDMGQAPGQSGAAAGPAATEFYMTDKVNAFSGVADYTPFTDVVSSAWYADAVSTAVENGWLTGLTDTTFGPTDSLTGTQLTAALAAKGIADATAPDGALTRQQLAQVLYDALGDEAEADLSEFSDADAIDADSLTAVQWAVARGLLQGLDDGTLRPDATVTRAQAAVILGRLD